MSEQVTIKPGDIISLGFGVGVWQTQDRVIDLNSSKGKNQIELTEELIEDYGPYIVKALNYLTLNYGPYSAGRPNSGGKFTGVSSPAKSEINEDSAPELKDVSSKRAEMDIYDSTLADATKEEIHNVLNGKVGEAKSYIDGLAKSGDIAELAYLYEYEEEHKNRKSVINASGSALKKLTVTASGVGWLGTA